MKISRTIIFLSYLAVSFVCYGCSGSATNGQGMIPELKLRDRCEIIFSGDFMQHLPQVKAAQRDTGFDYRSTLRHIAPYWRSADFTVVNLETTLAFQAPYTGYPMFRSPSAIAQALHWAGVTLVALANNHAMDCGLPAVRSTIKAINQAGLRYVGVDLIENKRSPVQYFQKGRLKIALLNYTYSTNGMPVPKQVQINMLNNTLIKSHIATARAMGATHIVAFVHWGDEYHSKASLDQRTLGAWLVASGVDCVVGSHPHVVQQIDQRAGVIYSLGNLVSNQRERYRNGGISVRLTFTEANKGAIIAFMPHRVDQKYNILLPTVGDMDQSFADSRAAVRAPLE
ncbi:MAG: CapA family protein [Mucinivorans sp.]